MRDKPDAAELLETARKVLVEELLPDLPRDRRYTALMVAATMAIAAREAEAGTAQLEQEHEALKALYESGDSLEALNRQFARDLRAGRFDGGDGAALAILRRSVLDRLAECNPRYLESESRGC